MLAKRLLVPTTRKEKPVGRVQSQQTGYSTRLRLPLILPATDSFLYSSAGVEGTVATAWESRLANGLAHPFGR
jgi:hypothetical protein